MNKGDSFLMGVLIKNNAYPPKKHLWVVLSDISKHGGYGVIVNLSTDELRAEGDCPCEPHEHPWLNEPVTWVCYGDAKLIKPEGWQQMQAGIKNRVIIPQAACTKIFVDKLVTGAQLSAQKPFPGFRKDFLPFLD
jgi:hypothetical protein